MRPITPLLLTLLLCACAALPRHEAPALPITLEVVREDPCAGDSLGLVLTNNSSAPVLYNLCASVLERRTDGEWERVPSERVCTMELLTLGPGREICYPMQLPQGTTPGQYRFLTRIDSMDNGSQQFVYSPPFQVGGR
jgi:hypothetical protein